VSVTHVTFCVMWVLSVPDSELLLLAVSAVDDGTDDLTTGFWTDPE